jgi:hypothetical protein
MSFHQKRALVSLIAIGIAAVGYAVNAWRFPPATLLQAAPRLIGAAIGLTIMMILAHILLAIGAGSDEARRPADERDRMVRTAARRNAWWMMGFGLVLTIGLQFVSASPVLVVQAGAAAFILAELVRYGSELFYYRQAR